MQSFIIRYAHLEHSNEKKAKLKKGQIIQPGHYLGDMGGSPYDRSGKSYYSPHLHIDARLCRVGEIIPVIYVWRLSETKSGGFEGLVNYVSKEALDEVVTGGPFSTQVVNKAPQKKLQTDKKGRLYEPGRYTITTRYLCPEYEDQYGVPHPAYDLVPHPITPPWRVVWSGRSAATVVDTGYDQPGNHGGYGNYVLLEYRRQ